MIPRARAYTRVAAALIAFATASGCHGGGAAGSGASSASPVASASGAPTPTPTDTAVPVHVSAQGAGGRAIEFTETNKSNKIVYTLKADSQTADRDPSGDGTSRFVNPRIRFVGTDGKVLFAKSPTGTVTERSNVVTVLMSGRVHAHTEDGTTLDCDTMRYDDANQTVHARGNVVLTTANERLSGGALDADLRLSHVHLTPGDS